MTETLKLEHFERAWIVCQSEVERVNRLNGWWEVDRNKAELLMLMVTELAEACEALRHGNIPSDHLPQFSGEVEELADCIIRIMDYAAGFGLPVGAAILDKIEYNKGRGYKHGKEF